jgi:probable phosphomutase (TIGR03848 family)
MSTILLIRHAEYPSLGQGLKGRLPGIHLDETGKAQAERISQRLAALPLRAVYSSPLERARETAGPIARRFALSVSIREDLQEIDYGDWTGRDISEMAGEALWKRFHAQRTRVRIPGGEGMIRIAERMVGALEDLAGRHRDEVIAVVSHGDPIRAALCVYLGIPLDFIDRLELLPASISILDLEESGVRLRRFNDTEGLIGSPV